MFLILALALSASGLKLAQYPDFETEMEIIETLGECSDRMNYKCFKKGGHSVEKEAAATYLRREQGVVSVAVTLDAECQANQLLTMGAITCVGVDTTFAVYKLTAEDVARSPSSATIPALLKGDRCTATGKPAASKIIKGTAANTMHVNCNDDGDFGVESVANPIRDTATSGLAHFTMRMHGFGLHAGGVPQKAASATDATICHTLSCVKGQTDANTCASAPAATLFKSMIWYCNSNSLEAKVDNHAACASVGDLIDVGALANDCHHMRDYFMCDLTFTVPTCR